MKKHRWMKFNFWSCTLISLAVLSSAARAEITHVWAVNDGEKVKRDETNHAERAKNSVWDGQSISLFGARNEIVAFQIITEAGPGGAQQVDVALPELVHPDGAKLVWKAPAEDPTDTREWQIERFTAHYLEITKATPPSAPAGDGWFYHPDAAPKDMLGWIPDALVPFNAKAGKGGGPFNIAGAQNQAVWFDIYIPRDALAGVYRGSVTVTEQGRPTKQIQVSLRVFDFFLPDQTHLPVMVFLGKRDIGPRHGVEGEAAQEMIERYHRLGHRHRIELTDAYVPPGTTHELARLSGEAFTAKNGYSGPGEGAGYRIVPATFWELWGDWTGRDPAKAHAIADEFATWVKKVKPDAITFIYMADEPQRGRVDRVRRIAEIHRANPGPGRELPLFVTMRPNEKLEGFIDIWATISDHVDLKQVAEQKAKGRQWWYYNGQRPQAGTNITDAPAVDNRVFAWANWKYEIPLWYYWSANHWRHNLGPVAEHHDQNVWLNPVTFARRDGVNVNGDGVLIYPGQDTSFPDEDRGIAGPIASIRLKNIRRGVQDYEYLWLAEQNGLKEQARAIADSTVPRAFSEATGDVSWSVRGSDWDAQRLRLAELLEQAMKRK